MKISDYPYLYETHMHTNESSACGADCAVDMAKAHKAAGYTGMIITNHNWGGNTCVDRSLPWTKWIDEFFRPYYLAKEWADKNEFDVFYGYEAGYDATEFLIYNISIEWLKAHPEIRDASVREQFELISDAGGLISHAHPFREASYISEIRLFPEYVHCVEGINAAHSSPKSAKARCDRNYNVDALEYAKKYNFPITGGSDTHSTNLFGGGMAFREKITSLEQFKNQVLNKHEYLVTDGVIWTDAYGNKVEVE